MGSCSCFCTTLSCPSPSWRVQIHRHYRCGGGGGRSLYIVGLNIVLTIQAEWPELQYMSQYLSSSGIIMWSDDTDRSWCLNVSTTIFGIFLCKWTIPHSESIRRRVQIEYETITTGTLYKMRNVTSCPNLPHPFIQQPLNTQHSRW